MLIFESYVKLKNRAFYIFYGMRGFTWGLGRRFPMWGGAGLRTWARGADTSPPHLLPAHPQTIRAQENRITP